MNRDEDSIWDQLDAQSRAVENRPSPFSPLGNQTVTTKLTAKALEAAAQTAGPRVKQTQAFAYQNAVVIEDAKNG